MLSDIFPRAKLAKKKQNGRLISLSVRKVYRHACARRASRLRPRAEPAPVKMGLGSKHKKISGFPPSRPGRNLQTRKMSLFVISGLTRNPLLFQSATVLDAGSSPA
jgi:hypothetical protein